MFKFTKKELKLESPSCTCDTCKKMCGNPCWPLPYEAEKIISYGFGSKLMLINRKYNYPEKVYVLSPSYFNYEGSENKVADKNCIFQDPKTFLCALHNLGLKPFEGRNAIHLADCHYIYYIREKILNEWNNKFAKELIESWKREYLVE